MKYSYKNWLTVSICFILFCWMCVEVYYIYDRSNILEGKLCEQNVDVTTAKKCTSAVVDVMDIAFWIEKENEVVSNYNGSKNSKLSIMYKVGKSSMLYPECEMLLDEDTRGCLLSAKSALELFGSREVIGLSVFYGEKEYVVRDIINCDEELLVLNATEEDGITFSHLTSGVRGGRIGEKKNALKKYCGLEVAEWNYNMLYNIIILELIITIIIVCWKISRKVQGIDNKNWTKKAIQILMYVLIWIAGTTAAVKFFTILGWPSKWSDFSYWIDVKREFFTLMDFLINSSKNAMILKRLEEYIILLFAAAGLNAVLLFRERKNCDL